MTRILAQNVQLTSQDGRLVRAVLRQLVQYAGEGEPIWEDGPELPIGEDGVSVALPAISFEVPLQQRGGGQQNNGR